MFDYKRNQLLYILKSATGAEERKAFNIDQLLEQYKMEIEREINDIEYKRNQLQEDLELVDYVKEEINKWRKEHEEIQ